MKFDTVQLFATCIVDTLYPEVGHAVVDVLERAGVRVEFPADQTCCGQPAFNAGMRRQARQIAEHTIHVFERAPGAIVIPSGSCAAMVRHSYLELFANDPVWLPRAEAMASRTFEFTEFLVDVLGVTDVGASYDGKVTYHSSCHLLREMGVDRQPRLLLSAVKGALLVELPHGSDCCGFGGVFSVEHPEISTEMLERKVESIELAAAPLVVSCDGGCITAINGGLNRRNRPQRAVHIAQLLSGIQEGGPQ
ncbi:MAG: (Fe-S)-binding protein [Chloroflexota bacterium]|nr:MAG: (Fe-S)-binding protein [Chloroflexota bacterium]